MRSVAWRSLSRTFFRVHPLSLGSPCRWLSSSSRESVASEVVAEVPIPRQTRGKKGGREKKRVKSTRKFGYHQICAAYAITGELDLKVLQKQLRLSGIDEVDLDRYRAYEIGTLVSMEGELVRGYTFFFPSGSIVFWGLKESERRQIFDLAGKLTSDVSIVPFDEFGHEFAVEVDSDKTDFRNDVISLRSFDDVDELLSISFGLAQSAKLQVFEEAIDRLVEETQILPEQLAKHGEIQMSKKNLKRRLGRLLVARYSVSLLSDILDTPEFFWDNPQLECLHDQCRNEVELGKRVQILTGRLDVIKDSLDLINTELAQNSSHRVEWYILSLIAVEIFIEVGKLLAGH